MNARAITLDTLGNGRRGRVLSIGGESVIRRRLLEMGMCRGVGIEVVRRGPFGDPIQLRVRGYQLSLRSEHASLVHIAPEG